MYWISSGKRPPELCKATKLLIANGHCGLDAQLGEYTYIGENGRSVVDCLLLSREYLNEIVNFYRIFGSLCFTI